MLDNIRELITKLNDATKAYDEGCPYMSDKQWDDLYFNLKSLEDMTGTIYPDSPTQRVNYQVASELKKVKHSHPMLSLAKTKSREDLISFIHQYNKAGCVEMLKMDGLTCSLTYRDHVLVSAETRGDGEIGEDITHNAKVVKNIPARIPWAEEIVFDGEIICTKNNFEPFSDQYKNPRNFAAGSIRLLDSSECANRNLSFICWDIITDLEKFPRLSAKLELAANLGFDVVPWIIYSGDSTLDYDEQWLKKKATEGGYPIDGLVFKYDDCETYNNLGYTDHHFRGGLAYKFYDETYTTYLRGFDWDVSRTGVLTPVAVFDPVDIDGSTVSRASVHNITLLEQTLGTPYPGEQLEVYKANEIIPQIYSAVKVNNPPTKLQLPTVCPICGEPLVFKKDGIATTLNCVNSNCRGKVLSRLEHFVSKQGMDIDGLARSTLEAMYDYLGVKTFRDIFQVTENELTVLPGFADISIRNTVNAIEAAKKVPLHKFITALGIPTIGSKQAAQLASVCTNWNDFRNKAFSGFDWTIIDGFGEKKSQAVNQYNFAQADEVVPYLIIYKEQDSKPASASMLKQRPILNKRVVITGSLNQFKNRGELKQKIEQYGGLVLDSVKKDIDLLINNDIFSNSAKNKKAKELGVRIISEEDFIKEYLND